MAAGTCHHYSSVDSFVRATPKAQTLVPISASLYRDDNASQCQTLPANAGHSHSIINGPFLQFNINGLLVGAGSNTMKNTMLKKSFKMHEKIAN
jgi:hypothetical protein